MILDVIIPTYNKEKNILNIYEKITEELKNIKHNLIFIDDSSTDKTFEVLKEIHKKNESGVKIISLSKKHGKDTCIYTGLYHSKHELVCIYDIDSQASVNYINKMYEFLTSHKSYDQVCMYSNHIETNFIRKNKIKLLNKLFDLDIDNNRTNYRMMRRNVVNAIIELTKYKKYSKYSHDMIGFNTYYIKYDNKNLVLNTNVFQAINYSNKPYDFIKYINYSLLFISIIIFIISFFKTFSINILILIVIVLNIFNLFLFRLKCNNCSNDKTYFLIKEKIGFDDNIL